LKERGRPSFWQEKLSEYQRGTDGVKGGETHCDRKFRETFSKKGEVLGGGGKGERLMKGGGGGRAAFAFGGRRIHPGPYSMRENYLLQRKKSSLHHLAPAFLGGIPSTTSSFNPGQIST